MHADTTREAEVRALGYDTILTVPKRDGHGARFMLELLPCILWLLALVAWIDCWGWGWVSEQMSVPEGSQGQ